MAVRKVTNYFRRATTRKDFPNRRIRILPYIDFSRRFTHVTTSTRLLKITTVRGAVTKDLLPGRRLLHHDALTIVNRCGLHVSRILTTLPKRQIASVHRIRSRPVTLVRYNRCLGTQPTVGIIRHSSATKDTHRVTNRQLTNATTVYNTRTTRLCKLRVLRHNVRAGGRGFAHFLMLTSHDHTTRFASPTHASGTSLMFALPRTRKDLSGILALLSFCKVGLAGVRSLPVVKHR